MYVFAHINLHSMVQYSWKIPHANDVCCVFLILISGADTHDTQSACSDQTAEGKKRADERARYVVCRRASSLAGV
jgi:hypothetical protein